MIIKTQLTRKDFVQVNLILLYKRFTPKLLTIGGIVFLALFIFAGGFNSPHFNASTLLAPVFMMGILPFVTFLTARSNYSSNKRITETIEYEFGNDNLAIKGESFSSQLSWNKIYKVSKLKNFILIFQTKQIANVIPRRDVWEGDITKLKEILDSHNVKNNL